MRSTTCIRRVTWNFADRKERAGSGKTKPAGMRIKKAGAKHD
jgi:hypothetical protein